jgi:hypothetical protein
MAKRGGGFIGQDGINAPDPATGVTGTAGTEQVTVSFTAPSDVGGATITGYRVQSNDGIGASGSASPITVTGLTNGTSYTFNVWAINPFGWSSPSGLSGSVTPSILQRAVFVGGNTNAMEYVDITTTGNGTDFGDLIASDRFLAGYGSTTRGIIAGGQTTNRIQYITIATTGNATDFGDMSYTIATTNDSGCSSPTRGITGGGLSGGVYLNNMDYVTIATTGNGTDFGDLTSARYGVSALASSTRGVWCGGQPSGFTNIMDYVTIATTGNATDFGDLLQVRRSSAALSSSTRGVIGGSYTPPGSAPKYQNLDYITIASTGNAADFGDATVGFADGCGTSGATRGLFSLGDGITIDQITIASTGNATDFGDTISDASQGGATSSYHGGLQ